MLTRRRLVGACGVVALLLGSPLVGPAGGAAATVTKPGFGARQPDQRQPHGARTVTLVTGDRVTVLDERSGRMSIQRGPGRGGVSFLTQQVRGHLQVVPTDAVALLHAGRLDERLFDVTELLRSGYDDRRGDLPLIVAYGTAKVDPAVRTALSGAGAGEVRELPGLGSLAVRERRSAATGFWKHVTGGAKAPRALRGGLSKVWLDGLRQPTLDVSVPQIGASVAWQAGFTGAGVMVAVLDTGVDDTHPDLAGRVTAKANFTDGAEDDRDLVGHGTHVASTIAGSGAASGGRYRGVAPDATLVAGKVCIRHGCAESWILAGMQWAAAEQHAKVVNLSLGGADTPEIDPLEEAINTLTAQYGTLFVVAAGNSGAEASMGSPASADTALAVGAVDDTDELAEFSSRGPRVGDGGLKPDLTAPGVAITAARGGDATEVPGAPGDPYTTLSGTSMATPHVAGSAAILAQRHPTWSPAQLKAGLMGAAQPKPAFDVYAQGAGRVNIGRAVTQPVTADPASVSFGKQRWPHHDDPTLATTIRYHNHGATDITLTCVLSASGPDAAPVPAGMFSLDRQTVTVPAGGEAEVTVTADTRLGPDAGLFGGRITATAGETVIQTPFAVQKEAESYDLTLVHRDRSGGPTADYTTIVTGLDNDQFPEAYDPDGTVTLRLPQGRYQVGTFIANSADDPFAGTMLVQPVLDLTRSQSVALDARLGKPVTVTVPEPGATAAQAQIGYNQRGIFTGLLIADGPDRQYTAQIGGTRHADGFTSMISTQWARVNPDGSTDNSPYAYHLAYYQRGRMWTGLTRHPSRGDLALVNARYAQTTPGTRGESAAVDSRLPDGVWGFTWSEEWLPVDLPFYRREYYNTDLGVQWSPAVQEFLPADPYPLGLGWQGAIGVGYQPGRSYTEQWNKAVFGPAFPARPDPSFWITRTGDSILAWPIWYTDAAGSRQGGAAFDTSRITLYRDNVKIGETTDSELGEFTVPATAGRYRLEGEFNRGNPITLSTKTATVWTFTSVHVDGGDPVALPLSVIRFTPPVDQRNTALADRPFLLLITVQTQPGSAAGPTRDLTIEVSYDDGATWQPAVVDRTPTGGLAHLHHPAGRGYVSLRAAAADTKGNTVTQTTIHAYRYAPRT